MNMRSSFLVICVLSCLTFAACSKDDGEVAENGGTVLPISDTYVHPLGDTLTVSYTSVSDWTLSIGENDKIENDKIENDIIKCDPDHGGSGTTPITFTVDPNFDKDTVIVLTFKSANKIDSFNIIQKAVVFDVNINKTENNDFKFSGNNDSIVFDWGKSTDDKGAKFEVTSNIEWVIDVVDHSDAQTNRSWYDLKKDKDVISEETSGGSVFLGNGDKTEGKTEFHLTASDYNLKDEETHPVDVVITPVRKDRNGKNERRFEDHKHKIAVSQEYLIFRLEQYDDYDLEQDHNTYELKTPFSELGNKYLTDKEVSDTVPGVQYFNIIYEEDKVEVVDKNWNGNHIPEYVSDVVYSDQSREDGRVLRRRTMKLTVPDPNEERYMDDEKDPSAKSVSLPLSMNSEVVEDAKITLNYTQNKYVLDMEIYGNEKDLIFGNSDTTAVKKVKITTKGPWKLDKDGTEKAEWLDVKSEGAGEELLELIVNEQNLLLDPKEATLTLSTNFGDKEIVNDAENDKLTVSQDEFLFTLEPEWYPGESIERLNVNEYSQKLVSSGDWTLKMVPEDSDHGIWVEAYAIEKNEGRAELNDDTLEGGPGEWLIYVKAKDANPHEKERKMNMTVTSNLHAGNDRYPQYKDGIPKPFNLNQKEYRFELVKDDKSIHDKDVPVPAYKRDANEYKFVVKCGAPWKISEYPEEWVKSISPVEGDGTKAVDVTVTFEDNVGDKWNEARDGDIKILSYKKALTLDDITKYSPDNPADDVEPKGFKVIQDAFVFNVTQSASLGEIGAVDNDSYELCNVKCTAEAPWRIETEEWVKYDGKEEGTQTVSVTLENNGALEERKSPVKIVCELIGETEPLDDIVQGPYKWEVNNKESYPFAELPGDECSGEFDLTCLGPWTASVDYESEDKGWINADSSGKGSSNSIKYKFSVDDNVSTTPREATITVTSTVGGHNTKFKVSQNDYMWKVTGVPSSETLDPLETKKYNLTVQCSGEWEVESTNSDFIKVPSYKPEGRDKITSLSFEVVKNYSKSDLNSTVTIRSKDNKDLSKEFTIKQNPYEFQYSGAPKDGKVNILGGDYPVGVTCSGSWEVASLDDDTEKFVESAKKSTDGKSLIIKIKPNYSTEKSYNGSVTIKTTDIPEESDPRTETIQLIQDKYLWDVSSVQDKYEISASSVTDHELCSGLESTGTLKAISDQSWIKCQITGGKLIIERAEEHTDTKGPRNATITIKSEHYEKNNSLTKTFIVTQKAAEK